MYPKARIDKRKDFENVFLASVCPIANIFIFSLYLFAITTLTVCTKGSEMK